MKKKYPCIVSIAGSDCSGGAGIQADIKTISALGGYAATVITALTAQNTMGVSGIYPVPSAFVTQQIQAVMEDICPSSMKIGMINHVEIVESIAQAINHYQPQHVVLDPVMVSTSGCKLISDEAITAITRQLIPITEIITPNLSETEILTGIHAHDQETMYQAAKILLSQGCKAALIKGGHLEGNRMCDLLLTQESETPYLFEAPKVESKNTHGTGCSLSSAIATFLALEYPLPIAVEKAKEYVYQGIMAGKDVQIGNGHGPLNHFFAPQPMHIFTKNE